MTALPQVDECTIQFNAKINSATTSSSSYGVNVNAEYRAWIFNAQFSASAKYANSDSEQREFSIEISVKAKQAPMPEGLKRVFDILEQSVINRAD
jgi:hypothetical protein